MSLTSRFSSGALVRAFFCVLIFAGLEGPAAQQSVAASFFLTDDNSTVHFETTQQINNNSWVVDGQNHLASQAFWFRIGNAGPEQSVHTALPITVQGTTDRNFDGNPDTLFVRYNGSGIRIETSYVLDGGFPGSGTSDLAEQIAISNLTAVPMDFHFFQYADFDLPGPGGDSAVFTNVNTVDQSNGGFRLTETVVNPVPSHREINFFPVTLNKLGNGATDNLDDLPPIGTVLGPGDMTWAYQWDFVLPPSSTFLISKDKLISGVPEPATCSLLSLAAGVLLAGYRKRRIG